MERMSIDERQRIFSLIDSAIEECKNRINTILKENHASYWIELPEKNNQWMPVTAPYIIRESCFPDGWYEWQRIEYDNSNDETIKED